MTATCSYCHRSFMTDEAHQADLPYPQHVTCSDVCSVIMACRKVSA